MSKIRFMPKTDRELQDASAGRLKEAGVLSPDAAPPREKGDTAPAPFDLTPDEQASKKPRRKK